MHTEVQRVWSTSFPDCPPIWHLLRRIYPDRWLRVHSLPDAKRLPTCHEDEEELLRRHEIIASRQLSSGGECALVIAYANGYRGQDEPPSVTAFGVKIMDGWGGQWMTDPRFVDELDDTVLAAAQFSYRPWMLTNLMLDVAYGRTAPLLFVALDSGRVYSPYDGGADLFFEHSEARDATRAELSAWVSRRPDGL
jgi:hypothetical protein